MPIVSLAQFSKRNMWPLPSGELAVRPGLRSLNGSYSNHYHTFAVVGTTNREMVLYSFANEPPSNFIGVEIWNPHVPSAVNYTYGQVLVLNTEKTLRVMTCAVILDQVMFGGPSIPTMWGYTGAYLEPAVAADSINLETTAITPIPRGLVASWCSRAVIASGRDLYFSDPVSIAGGSPRTFVADNVQVMEGFIYGLHVGVGGTLIIVTSAGVYGLPYDSGAGGQIVSFTVQKMSDYHADDYNQSCVGADGRAYGLTQNGFRLIDSDNVPEHTLDEPVVNTEVNERIAYSDWRRGRIMWTPDGFTISHPEGGCFYMYHTGAGFGSWWTFPPGHETHKLWTVVQGPHGDTFIYTSGSDWMIGGNFDGDDVVTSEDTAYGAYVGEVVLPPDSSQVLRRVDYTTNSQGAVTVTVAGRSVSTTPTAQYPLDDAATLWGTAPAGTRRSKSVRMLFADRYDDMGCEIAVKHPYSKMPPGVAVETKGPGRRRP